MAYTLYSNNQLCINANTLFMDIEYRAFKYIIANNTISFNDNSIRY